MCLCCLCAVLCSSPTFGQVPQARVDTLTGEQPFALHPFIVPGTLVISAKDRRLSPSDYQLDTRFHRLWIPSLATNDTATVSYRIWDLNLPDQFTRVLGPLPPTDSLVPAQLEEPAPLSQPTQLRRSGSITRGILAGNNRDATIESGLRLQMSGQLSPNIHVRAALTDENTPILPEGTTQRLSELDRVFIEIDTPFSSAQLGDFQLELEPSVFARLNRKIQGVGITTPLPFKTPNGTLRAAAATSRGLFKTQDLQVKDGVQGPYRLQGSANEPFILVIPGSETIYLDGIRLERGESQDYVIDYATGEITFTTNRLIKYHHRIAVEFQYRTTEFTRTLAATEATVATSQRDSGPPLASLGVTFIREADGKSFDQEFGLTADDKQLLAQLGDSEASRSGATPVIYDPDAPWVHYMQVDTTIAGQSYQIYLPIIDASESEVFRVEFTRVGPGQGDYVRQGQTTNGIVYSYRGPGQGEYSPIRVLPKPAQQRMFDLRGSFAPIRYVEIAGEWAHSYRDENRFSSLDADNDRAHSYHVQLKVSDLRVGLGTTGFRVSRRRTGKNFAAFDRTQPVEFVRSWNLPIDRGLVQAHQETIDEVSAAWQLSETSSITGTIGQLEQFGVFKGDRREATLIIDESYLPKLDYLFIHIKSDANSVIGKWVRHDLQASRELLQNRLRVQTRLKTSQRHQHISQGLREDSRQYWEISPAVELRGDWGMWSAGFDWREEHLWSGNYNLLPGRRTATTSMNYQTGQRRSFQSQGRLGVQYTNYTDFFQTTQGLLDERSLVVRWDGRAQPWGRLLRLNWFYEALSEQTPVLQEIYIRTGPELGEYVWNDSNGNGVVEIDEFTPEVTQNEGVYARTLIPSDSLQSVTGLKARLNVQFEGMQRWRTPKTVWQKWLRQVTLKTAIEVQEKSKDSDPVNIYLLRQSRFRHPENTVRGTLNLMQDLWLFRNQPQYGFHASWRKIRSTNVFSADTEMRSIDEFRAQIRWSPRDIWAFELNGAFLGKVNQSTAFDSREFDIQTRSFVPKIQWSVTSNIRLSSGLDYARKNTRTRGRATIVKLPLQGSWDRAGRSNISARFELTSVMLTAEPNSRGLAFFELTDGRGAGRSLLWHVNAWLQLNRVLRATLSYSGRSPQDVPQVHTVRMQLSAVF